MVLVRLNLLLNLMSGGLGKGGFRIVQDLLKKLYVLLKRSPCLLQHHNLAAAVMAIRGVGAGLLIAEVPPLHAGWQVIELEVLSRHAIGANGSPLDEQRVASYQ
ncbi:hypothetical protein D9M71_747170 [compost metagenome]